MHDKEVEGFLKSFLHKGINCRVIFIRILKELGHKVWGNDILEHAYAVAFNFTLAIFPATIFIFTLIPYIPIPDLLPKLVEFLKEAMPPTVYKAILPTIQDTLSKQRTDLLSFGIIYSLYLATNGMMSLLKNFDLADQIPLKYKRSYLKQRGIATLLTLAFTLTLFVTLLLLILARKLLKYMVQYEIITSKFQLYILSFARPFIILLMFFIVIVAIYYLAVPTIQRKKFISIGALVATIGSFLASLGFSYYVNNFANYDLYGSLGIMIALMLWLFLIALMLLLGFELNITLTRMLAPSKDMHTMK